MRSRARPRRSPPGRRAGRRCSAWSRRRCPRVGSSAISSGGRRQEPAREQHLLLVAARQRPDPLVRSTPRRTPTFRMLSRTPARSRDRDDDTAASRRRRRCGRLTFSRIARSRISPCSLRDSGIIAIPVAIASRGEFAWICRPSSSTRPDVCWSAPKMARAISVRPAPTRPARTTISPARTSKVTSSTCGSRVRPCDPEDDRRVGGREALRREGRAARLRPIIPSISVSLVSLAGRGGPHDPAVAHDRDGVGDLEDLLEEVRDQEDGRPAGGERPDQAPQAGGVGRWRGAPSARP